MKGGQTTGIEKDTDSQLLEGSNQQHQRVIHNQRINKYHKQKQKCMGIVVGVVRDSREGAQSPREGEMVNP